MSMGSKAMSLFHGSNKKRSQICCLSQEGACSDPTLCKRMHCCIGCATEGKPYDQCHYLLRAPSTEVATLMLFSGSIQISHISNFLQFQQGEIVQYSSPPLLVAADDCHESDLLEALRISEAAQSATLPSELVFFPFGTMHIFWLRLMYSIARSNMVTTSRQLHRRPTSSANPDKSDKIRQSSVHW